MPELKVKGVAAPIPWEEGGFIEAFRVEYIRRKKAKRAAANKNE